MVAKEQFGLVFPPSPDRVDPADLEASAKIFAAGSGAFAQILFHQQRPGDVVLLRMGRWPAHVGIIVASGWMLHLEAATECLPERLGDRLWRGRLVGVFRHRDLMGNGA